ncbi:hypothetical protein FB561_2276 [Kribbella amoyensis]|uniref:Flavoprotein n=1 Tax=Kribbella amoyensis TaxID=996641 RepID=A0A561BQU1_9ACTN|nr:hypothetical protein FB561_2276 [Kribbella amoyensis]
MIGVVGSSAGGVEHLRSGLVEPLIAEGYQVAVTLTPTAARWLFPRVNAGHARHPSWEGHLGLLRKAEVRLVYGEDVWALRQPQAAGIARPLPWATILGELLEMVG